MVNILVLEDELTSIRSLRELLAHTHSLSIVNKVVQAWDLFKERHFDMVLLNLFVSDGLSLEFCREIKNENLFTSVFFITDSRSLGDLESCFKMGADDYLRKSFNISELGVRVEASLRKYRRLRGFADEGKEN